MTGLRIGPIGPQSHLPRVLSLQDLFARLSRAEEREKEIYRTEDTFGSVVVREYDGLRTLCFDSLFEQSAMRVDNPLTLVHEYTRAMLLALLFKEPEQVALLGLGGGSLLRSLHSCCSQADFQVVELRKSVIHIAIDHFFAPNDARVHFHNRNGIDYLNDASVHSADMVFADMYQAYSMEGFQSSERFLEQCWKLLTADGWLIINFHELPYFGDPYLDRMCDLFPEVLCCGTSSGNYVVMCGKQKLAQSLPEFQDGLDELEQRFDVSLQRSFSRIFKLSTPGAKRARANRQALCRST